MLKAAEERQHRRASEPEEPRGWIGRVQERTLAWVAERIAEQRLLWNLRKQTTAVAAHPQDMTFEQVMVLIRRTLQRDYERHRLWLVVDTIGLVGSSILALVPGPQPARVLLRIPRGGPLVVDAGRDAGVAPRDDGPGGRVLRSRNCAKSLTSNPTSATRGFTTWRRACACSISRPSSSESRCGTRDPSAAAEWPAAWPSP